MFAKTDYPKDIRAIVQELNEKRGRMEEMEKEESNSSEEECMKPATNSVDTVLQQGGKESQWASFMEACALLTRLHS